MQIDIEANTIIGKDSTFFGRYSIKGNLRIDGKFEGDRDDTSHQGGISLGQNQTGYTGNRPDCSGTGIPVRR